MSIAEDHESVRNFKYGYITTTILGLIMVIMVYLWIIWDCDGFAWTSDPKIEFNWHPLLMTVGMLFLYGQASLSFRLFRNVDKEKVKWIHASLNATIFVFIIIAQIAVLDSHNLRDPPIPNFYTLHSWVGLLAIFLFMTQYFGGFIAFLFPKLSAPIRKMYLGVHVHFGTAILITVTISCVSGVLQKAIFKLGKNYGQFPTEGIRMNIIGMLMTVFSLMVIYLLKENSYRRLPKPEEREVEPQRFAMK